MEDLRRSVAALAPIPAAAAREYRAKMATLQEHADRELADYLAIEVLIGFNPVEAMYDQHRYHAIFMANTWGPICPNRTYSDSWQAPLPSWWRYR